jgi:CheY-like chemotaxis protein
MTLANHTILLVEDDPTDALLLRRTFDRFKLNHPTQVVSNGEAAIEYLSGKGQYCDRTAYPMPTLLFLDLKLPGLSGFEVLTWIRQNVLLSRLQVIVLTGSRKTLDVYRAYELGANSYLVKPIRAEDLMGLASSLSLPWLNLADSRPQSEADPVQHLPRLNLPCRPAATTPGQG